MFPGFIKGGLNVLAHIVTWALLGFVILFYPPFTWDVEVPHGFWIKQAFNLVLFVALFYFNRHYAAPKLLFQNSKLPFLIWALLASGLILVLARFVEVQLNVLRDMSILHNRPEKNMYSIDMYLFMISLIVLAVSTGIVTANKLQEDAQARQRVEQQQVISELALLKAQINPHFFFNTLNNIYALTYSDVHVSRESILKLSRMMRFVLHDTLHDTAPLSQEISFLQDYISLMNLRLHELTTLDLKVEDPDGEYMIAPMLLLPFIENAFKHGTSALQAARIDIRLSARKGLLSLRVFNYISHEKDAYDFDRGGIGLANTRKRLQLLYPQTHTLQINENRQARTYEVLLTITLGNGPAETPKHETELHHS